MNGEDALARTLQLADTLYGVPGYPISGLMKRTGTEIVINEKVALEYALGDSLSGLRSAVIVKNVGVNTLADPLANASYQGLIGGVIVVAGDDPTSKNSQTNQNSAYYGPVAQVPVLDTRDRGTQAIPDAFTASEIFSRVALVRVTPEFLQSSGNTVPSPSPRGKGRIADTDLTMFGRAVHVSEKNALIEESGYAPFPLPRVLETGPLKRSERGYVIGLCRSCPYRHLFDILKSRNIPVIIDTGCSLMSMNPPYSFGIVSYGMGSSIAVAARSTGIALLGDYDLFHSGLQALIEVYQKQLPVLSIIMRNRCMGMTGGQLVPDPLPYLTFANPIVCDADDVKVLERVIGIPGTPVTLVVSGSCPDQINHETVACRDL